MAELDGRPSRELLLSELNKLNKKVIIDILVTGTIGSDVTSEVLKKFFDNLFASDGNHENSATDDGSIPGRNKCCEQWDNDKEASLARENNHLKKENCLLQRFNDHMEKRVKDLECIVHLVRQGADYCVKNNSSLSAVDCQSQKSSRVVVDKRSDSKVNSTGVNAVKNKSDFMSTKPTAASNIVTEPIAALSSAPGGSACGQSRRAAVSNNTTSAGRKSGYRRPLIGCNSEVKTVSAVRKNGYLHVYRMDPKTTESSLRDYLKQTAPSVEFKCEMLKKTDVSSSFKVTFPIECLESVYVSEIWPHGAAVKRFIFPRKQNSSENFPTEASQDLPMS